MIRIDLHTDNAAFAPESGDIAWRLETARLLEALARQIANGRKLPIKLRDTNGNQVLNVSEVDPDEEEISVILIEGQLHQRLAKSGTWIPFQPNPGQKMRLRK
ncbi:MAG: hypothetical protein QM680_10040 [Luteolibacter sp.]